MAAHDNGGFEMGGGNRNNMYEPGFHPGLNLGRGSHGGGQGFPPRRG